MDCDGSPLAETHSYPPSSSRRHFVVQPGLLRWFEDDSPTAALRGEMELDASTVLESRPDGGDGASLVVRSTMRTTVQE